jgi:hypothetical protein
MCGDTPSLCVVTHLAYVEGHTQGWVWGVWTGERGGKWMVDCASVEEAVGGAQAGVEAIGRRSASTVQAVGVTQGVVEAIGRGLVPPAEGTEHSALPNALFLWGKAAARLRRAAWEEASVRRSCERRPRGGGKGTGERGTGSKRK